MFLQYISFQYLFPYLSSYKFIPIYIHSTSSKNTYNFSSFCFLFSFRVLAYMAMEVVDQDEILFADLNKQISLLIMDDDADHHHYPPASYQVYSRVVHPITQPTQVVFNYEQSKGTGVFIPRSTHHRRKSKQGKLKANYNAATSKNTRESQTNSEGLMLPQGPQQYYLSSNNYTSYSSFNHKRI